ncbi:unnamed protein product, partial [Prorocentrum cordatum]
MGRELSLDFLLYFVSMHYECYEICDVLPTEVQLDDVQHEVEVQQVIMPGKFLNGKMIDVEWPDVGFQIPSLQPSQMFDDARFDPKYYVPEAKSDVEHIFRTCSYHCLMKMGLAEQAEDSAARLRLEERHAEELRAELDGCRGEAGCELRSLREELRAAESRERLRSGEAAAEAEELVWVRTVDRAVQSDAPQPAGPGPPAEGEARSRALSAELLAAAEAALPRSDAAPLGAQIRQWQSEWAGLKRLASAPGGAREGAASPFARSPGSASAGGQDAWPSQHAGGLPAPGHPALIQAQERAVQRLEIAARDARAGCEASRAVAALGALPRTPSGGGGDEDGDDD